MILQMLIFRWNVACRFWSELMGYPWKDISMQFIFGGLSRVPRNIAPRFRDFPNLY